MLTTMNVSDAHAFGRLGIYPSSSFHHFRE